MERCSECCGDVKSWRDNDANPELKEYIDSYVSPPKMYHFSLMDALKAWGEEFTQEDVDKDRAKWHS